MADKAPDGSDLSNWQEYKFTPQPDITAYELAVMLAAFQTLAAPLMFPKPHYRDEAAKKVPQFFAMEDQLMRHLTKVEGE